MVKSPTEAPSEKKAKHAHPRDAKSSKKRKVFVANYHAGGEVTDELTAFRRKLRKVNVNADDDVEVDDDIPVTRRRRKGDGEPEHEDSRFSIKYVILMVLMLLPGVLEMVAMSGGLYNSAHFFLLWLCDPRHIAIVVLAVATPVLLFKLLPARLVTLLMVASVFGAIVYPTAGVYFCSPVMMNYTHFASNYSLRLSAAEISKQAVAPCMRRVPFAVYRLSGLSPQLSLVMAPKDVINVNITSSYDSPLPYRLLMAVSGRSVKGRWHLIYLLAKVPRRLAMRDIFTSLLEDDRDEASYVVRGKLIDTPKSMKPMQQQLAEGKLMRPLMMEVHGIEAFT